MKINFKSTRSIKMVNNNQEISNHVNNILKQAKILKFKIKTMQISNYKLMMQISNVMMKT